MLFYLDGIVIFLKNANKHMAHLAHVLTLLRDAAVTCKLRKSSYHVEKTNYLGHSTQLEGPELPETTTTAVHELKDPTPQAELRFLLCLRDMFCRFVPSFSKVGESLNRKLQKY